MGNIGGKRNYGYGKQIAWAGQQALLDRYGSGHYATRAAHAERWHRFTAFAKQQGINDARKIDRNFIKAYAEYLKNEVNNQRMKVAYAQNLLSTVNTILETLRKDTVMRISPSQYVGKRSNIRTTPPEMNRNVLTQVTDSLRTEQQHRVAIIAELARHFGLRFREASLLNATEALKQARQFGRINITEGTKGGRGREVDRWVPVSERSLQTLTTAAALQQSNRNLLPEDRNYQQWRDLAYNAWRKAATSTTLKGFHDLRAAYACERYKQLTGHPPPVMTGNRSEAPKSVDQQARIILAQELGHGRTDVMAAYIGGGK